MPDDTSPGAATLITPAPGAPPAAPPPADPGTPPPATPPATPPAAPPATPPNPDGTLLNQEPDRSKITEPPPAEPGKWKTDLAELFKEPALKVFEGFEDKDMVAVPREMVEKMGKSYLETKKMAGSRLSMPPVEGAPPEADANWRKLVGAPDKPEGYGALRPEGIPEDHWSGEEESAYKEVFHKHRATPEMAKDLAQVQAKFVKDALDKYAAEESRMLEQGAADLKSEWGDQMETRIKDVQAFATLAKLPHNHPALRDPSVVKALYTLGSLGHKGDTNQGTLGTPTGLQSMKSRLDSFFDPTSTSPEARAYRGETVPGVTQAQAAETLLGLQKALSPSK